MLFGAKLDSDDADASYLLVGDIESAYDEDFTNEKVDMYYNMSKLMILHEDDNDLCFISYMYVVLHLYKIYYRTGLQYQ